MPPKEVAANQASLLRPRRQVFCKRLWSASKSPAAAKHIERRSLVQADFSQLDQYIIVDVRVEFSIPCVHFLLMS
jgi:hypothetical protein